MQNVVFSLKVNEGKRFIVDQNNVPFLIQGDALWALIVGLTREETEQYLRNRRLKGFNTILVNLIEHKFCKSPPKNIMVMNLSPRLEISLLQTRDTLLTLTG
jgi:hypothetical protein